MNREPSEAEMREALEVMYDVIGYNAVIATMDAIKSERRISSFVAEGMTHEEAIAYDKELSNGR